MQRLVLLQKAATSAKKSKPESNAVEDEDGVLTPKGMEVAHTYAVKWRTQQVRDTALEREYPDLIGLFYDIRNDSTLAAEHAIPLEKSEAFQKALAAVREGVETFQKEEAMRYFLGVDPAVPESETTTCFVLRKGDPNPLFIVPLEGYQKPTETCLEKASMPVIAIGPKGGKVVGYDSKGKPIYEKQDTEQQTMSFAVQATTEGGKRVWIDHKPGLPRQTVDQWRLAPPPENANPAYRTERQGLHRELIDSFFVSPATGNKVKKPPAGAQKVAFVMMGGTASGKTTAVKRLLGVEKGSEIEDKGFVNFNPDDVKERLPEYKESINFEHEGKKVTARDAAFMVHEESSDIAHEVLEKALDEGYNVVVDGTGKNADKHIKTIERLKRLGYRVQLVMPDVDVEGSDGAATRAINRAEGSGRFVPMGPPPPGTPDILRDIHYQIPANFERVAAAADEFTLFDGRGFPPEIKYKGAKGQAPEVLDQEWLDSFRERGQKMQAAYRKWKEAKKRNPDAPAPRVEPLQKAEESEPLSKSTYEEGDLSKKPKKPKFPGAGKVPRANIPWPVNHGPDPARAGKRIKYVKVPAK